MKRVLTIAGSDSGGGAGIQADLKTITLLGGFGMSALTALTAQNTQTVASIHALPSEFVAQQIDTVLSDIGADSAKTGMLFNTPVVKVVADRLSNYGLDNLVVDPVMVAKSGDTLLSDDAVETMVQQLIPMALVVTPNLAEAEILARMTIRSERDMHEAARKIHAMGPRFVLLKGGHRKGRAEDILFDGNDFLTYGADRIDTLHTHGTGCVYSAAIATYLAMGQAMKDAVESAKAFVHAAISVPLPLGHGHGPTNTYAPFARELGRYEVLESLKAALARLQAASVGHLIPEVQSNLGYALPMARDIADVAAFAGRLVTFHGGVAALAGPEFGASRHISSIVLTVMRHDCRYRSAMNIRFSERRVRHCESLGWDVASFDRQDEPKGKKEREGSTLEWGTASIFSKRHHVPDMIFDRGEVGKEPMIRVLGKNPEDVVGKVLALKDT